jgi:hypothetical protein
MNPPVKIDRYADRFREQIAGSIARDPIDLAESLIAASEGSLNLGAYGLGRESQPFNNRLSEAAYDLISTIAELMVTGGNTPDHYHAATRARDAFAKVYAEELSKHRGALTRFAYDAAEQDMRRAAELD